MSRLISRAEGWEKVYTAFQNINFAAFDFNTIKQSVLDYIKLYFPETFNDYIESSEFIAIIEIFAYIGELLSYRIDVNAHENFLSTAQRKDSVLRLAKFISYTASRPLPARGLVKITSVSTTESVIDANGVDLANRIIRWNDVSNSNWKDQFLLVMNKVLDQEFGSVGPLDRFQIQDVLFELYALNMVPLLTGVFPYSATVNGQSLPMELVPVSHDVNVGIVERRPAINANFTLLYGQDGLGDASDTTGFFCFTKQGTLQRIRTVFDGITPNQSYDVTISNINDIDVWVNNVNPVTGETLDIRTEIPYRTDTVLGKSGEWTEVDLAHAQNVIFNTNPKRNKYELETLVDNQLRVIFGDGEFADIPAGDFDIWVRSSVDQDIIVSQSSVVDTKTAFTYIDKFNRTQTFTFQFSLIGSLQNASASEDIEHIRKNASAVYYSQDRMVNGEDYNVFMLQDPSILLMRSINRTFAGDSRYMTWHDPSGTYSNVKLFGDDGMLYYQDILDSVDTPLIDINTLITTYIEPLLSSTDIFIQISSAGVPANQFKRIFTPDEIARLQLGLTPPPTPVKTDLYYNTDTYEWYAIKQSDDPAIKLASVGWPLSFITFPLISINQTSIFETRYNVSRLARRLMFSSSTTAFWNHNSASRVIEYDTLNSDDDEIVIMQANVDCNRKGILQQNWRYNVLGQAVQESGTSIGLPDINRLSILPVDEESTGVPLGLNVEDFETFKGVANIIKPKIEYDISDLPNTLPGTGVELTLPIYYWAEIVNPGDPTDIEVFNGISHTPIPRGPTTWDIIVGGSATTITNKIILYTKGTDGVYGINKSLIITINEYVYQQRASIDDPWIDVSPTIDNMYGFAQSEIYGSGTWRRFLGRSGLNFTWLHRSPRYHLVDPAPSNIIDTFIITKGYYIAIKRWLENSDAVKPDKLTPLDLRNSYGYLLDNKMISDTVILHPGQIKLLFGPRAHPSLQATFKIIRSQYSSLTDNQIKTIVTTTIRNFFDISLWTFGETFYFTELSAAIHQALPVDISSVVLVPNSSTSGFGSLFQVYAREDEVFYPDISPNQIDIVVSYNASNLQIGKVT